MLFSNNFPAPPIGYPRMDPFSENVNQFKMLGKWRDGNHPNVRRFAFEAFQEPNEPSLHAG